MGAYVIRRLTYGAGVVFGVLFLLFVLFFTVTEPDDIARKALGDKAGITRYGFSALAMDEALTEVALDISGRPFLVWKVDFVRPKVGDMDTELFQEWFQAFVQNSGTTLHVMNRHGDNSHHIIETCFKGLGRAFRQAITLDLRQQDRIPSTKGQL